MPPFRKKGLLAGAVSCAHAVGLAAQNPAVSPVLPHACSLPLFAKYHNSITPSLLGKQLLGQTGRDKMENRNSARLNYDLIIPRQSNIIKSKGIKNIFDKH